MKLCFGQISPLADRIHGADAAIRSAARHCAKKLPRSQRDLLFRMSPAPREPAGTSISFDVEGWMNASHAGGLFEKDPGEWQGLDLTRLYVTELSKRRGVAIESLLVTRRGNERLRGLWLHPKLAGKFARWLSIDFEIWFDDQMEALTSRDMVAVEAARRQAAMGFRSLCEALVMIVSREVV